VAGAVGWAVPGLLPASGFWGSVGVGTLSGALSSMTFVRGQNNRISEKLLPVQWGAWSAAFEKHLESAAISLKLAVFGPFFEPFVGIVVLRISIMRFVLIWSKVMIETSQ